MSKENTALNRRSVLAGAAGLGAFAIGGRASAASEVTWRVQAHWPKASSSFNDSLGVFATQLEERTDGRMKLELFGAGEFAKGAEIFNIVKRGVVQMGSISPGYIQNEATTAGLAFGIPGTQRESWEAQHLLMNLGVQALFTAELEKQGVTYFGEKVYPTELVVTKPINSPDDFKGLKLRSSGTLLQYLESAGAAPTYVAGPELYQALASGVVDGAHWGAAIGAKSMSLWEVAKYHLKPTLAFASEGFIVNMDAYSALPDDLRLIYSSLATERFFLRSAEYMHKEAIALNSGIKEQGVQVVTLPDSVLEVLAAASGKILEAEAAKSAEAAQAADALRGLMSDLGYV